MFFHVRNNLSSFVRDFIYHKISSFSSLSSLVQNNSSSQIKHFFHFSLLLNEQILEIESSKLFSNSPQILEKKNAKNIYFFKKMSKNVFEKVSNVYVSATHLLKQIIARTTRNEQRKKGEFPQLRDKNDDDPAILRIFFAYCETYRNNKLKN